MVEKAWTVWWEYGMTNYYVVPPGGSSKDSYDLLILTINPDAHENGQDEKNAQTCAKTLSKRHAGEG